MWRRICPAESSRPIPYPSTPTLLLIVVRFFVPLRASARIRFSGIPHRPKPPIMIVAPSGISRMASSELATTFFIGEIVKEFLPRRHGGRGGNQLSGKYEKEYSDLLEEKSDQSTKYKPKTSAIGSTCFCLCLCVSGVNGS